jgi:hypothetical protein
LRRLAVSLLAARVLYLAQVTKSVWHRVIDGQSRPAS